MVPQLHQGASEGKQYINGQALTPNGSLEGQR